MELVKKNAVITGGTGGIGGAIVMALIGKGVNVCLLSRHSVDVRTYAQAGYSGQPVISTYRGDLACDTDIAAFCEYIGEQLPTVDILVHSAGAYCAGTLEDTPVEELDLVYRVNVRAPYLLTRLLLPRLKQSKGQIVFMNSSAGVKAGARLSQYASSKFALRALSDSLRQEVNGDEVRVLSVFPGRTASKMQEAVHRLEQHRYDPRYLVQPQDIAEIVVKSLELPKSAEVTDIHIRPFSTS
jgi:NADP-dependent 3-hydroxy acid dehydrogenase YdfG